MGRSSALGVFVFVARSVGSMCRGASLMYLHTRPTWPLPQLTIFHNSPHTHLQVLQYLDDRYVQSQAKLAGGGTVADHMPSGSPEEEVHVHDGILPGGVPQVECDCAGGGVWIYGSSSSAVLHSCRTPHI